VPVGTQYHWCILAHQNVTKLNANDYTTALSGLKFKIAHRRAGSAKWSATPKTQRRRMIAFLQDVIRDLERAPAPPARSGAPKQRTRKRPARAAPRAAAPAPKGRLRLREPAAPPSMRKPPRRRRQASPTRGELEKR
jgi:hypothetical protein